MTLDDLLNAAGINGVIDDRVQIVTYNTPDFMPKTVIVDRMKEPNYRLSPSDQIYVFDYYKTHREAYATIGGEVIKPGRYAIDTQTTLSDLIDVTGGLAEKASTKGEIVRYYVENGERKRKIIPFDLSMEKEKDIVLQNHDIVTIFRIPNWNEQMRVTLKGEVRYPGTYIVKEGERLAHVIERAGGFTRTAFIEGAIFTRESVREMQRRELQHALERMKKRAMVIASQPSDFGVGKINSSDLLTSIDAVIAQAREAQPIGRISIALDRDLKKFEKSESNIVLKDGDTLVVPTHNDTVTVLGEVLNPTAMIYKKSMTPWDYIEKAGGLNDNANPDMVYIVHANGEAEKLESGFFFSGNVHVKPGDSIVAPIYIKTTSNMQIAKDATQIIYQTAVSIAAIGSL
jgi:polysaccharide export outer membrane protein